MSEIYKALFKLQGLIRGVQKDSKNPHFKNNYASLEQVTDTIRPHMQACGLVWFQFPGRVNDGSIEVTTTIAHAESGETISGTMEVPLGKKDPQGAGSSITYGLRYSLMAVLGLPPTDDDAETAIDRDDKRPEPNAANTSQKASAAHQKRQLDVIEKELLDTSSPGQLRKLYEAWLEIAKSEGWSKDYWEAAKARFTAKNEEITKMENAA